MLLHLTVFSGKIIYMLENVISAIKEALKYASLECNEMSQLDSAMMRDKCSSNHVQRYGVLRFIKSAPKYRKKIAGALPVYRITPLKTPGTDAKEFVAEKSAPKQTIPTDTQTPRFDDSKARWHITANKPAISLEEQVNMLEKEILRRMKPSFAAEIQRYVRERFDGNPVPVYRAAGMSRQQYSAMISNSSSWHPSKRTALSFALALKLRLSEAESLLSSAGYSFSTSIKEDIVFRHCFIFSVYGIADVNNILREFDLQPLKTSVIS